MAQRRPASSTLQRTFAYLWEYVMSDDYAVDPVCPGCGETLVSTTSRGLREHAESCARLRSCMLDVSELPKKGKKR